MIFRLTSIQIILGPDKGKYFVTFNDDEGNIAHVYDGILSKYFFPYEYRIVPDEEVDKLKEEV